ncbi:MAG: hypothetical protein ACK4YM_03465 [Novosphingobium sp.]
MARLHPSAMAMLGGVVLYAALALGNGLDRLSATRPQVAQWVPGPLRAEGWRAEAARLLEAGDGAGAAELAKRAVRADPIDPRSTALLGAGQLAERKALQADRAFRVAARFGWRDPLTQIYFMNAGLAAGQPRLAALRLDAVLRQAPFLPVRDMLFARFEATPDGRAALAERLAMRPSWTESYLTRTGDLALPTLQARAAIVASMKGPDWNCDTVEPLVTKLISKGGIGDAKQLWLAQCPHASPGIADPRFTRLRRNANPVAFEWNLADSGDVALAPGTSEGGLLARVSGPASLPIAWQMITPAPGRYRVSWTAQTASGAAARGAGLSLSCKRNDRQTLPASDLGKGRFEAIVTIDGACPGRYLTLWLAPGTEDVRFDNLAIAPL